MSARFPTETASRIVHVGPTAEIVLATCIELGIPAKVHNPDIKQVVKLEVFAPRVEFYAARKVWLRRMTGEGSAHRTPLLAPGSRRVPEYTRCQPWEKGVHRAKLYCDPEIVCSVCREHGLEFVTALYEESPPFYVVSVIATDDQYKAAQFDWLQKMIQAAAKPLVSQLRPDEYF